MSNNEERPLRIDTKTLRKALERALDHLDEMGHSSLDLRHDYYWNVPTTQRYDPYENPVELDLGQLSFDLEHIEALASGRRDPVAYDLVWLASLLRAIGEQTTC